MKKHLVEREYREGHAVLSTHGNRLNAEIKLYNFNNAEIGKMSSAISHASQGLNSQAFKTWCLNHKYKKRIKTGWFRSKTVLVHGFHKNGGLDNQQIYDLIMGGRETLQQSTVGVMNIVTKIDDRNKRGVLGYTYANSIPQYIYNWFFQSGSLFDIAGNTIHEWMHKLNFKHARRFNSMRRFTVPYAVGYWIRDYRNAL